MQERSLTAFLKLQSLRYNPESDSAPLNFASLIPHIKHLSPGLWSFTLSNIPLAKASHMAKTKNRDLHPSMVGEHDKGV